jgi:hypothetical protein
MNLFQKLTAKRSELAHEISVRREMLVKSERAVALCDKLEAGLPKLVAAIRGEAISPAFSQYAAAEDFTGRHDLALQAKAVKAADRLLKDLPAIRAHWVKVRDGLAK